MMAPLCQAQLVLALEDTPDSQAVLLRMVNNAGLYSLGVGSSLLVMVVYTVVLSVAGWHLSLFSYILMPILLVLVGLVILRQLSPLEDLVISRDGSCTVSVVGVCGTRIIRLQHVQEAVVQELVYAGPDNWGLGALSQAHASRLALIHEGGVYLARTILAADDHRLRLAVATINLFLLAADLHDLEAMEEGEGREQLSRIRVSTTAPGAAAVASSASAAATGSAAPSAAPAATSEAAVCGCGHQPSQSRQDAQAGSQEGTPGAAASMGGPTAGPPPSSMEQRQQQEGEEDKGGSGDGKGGGGGRARRLAGMGSRHGGEECKTPGGSELLWGQARLGRKDVGAAGWEEASGHRHIQT